MVFPDGELVIDTGWYRADTFTVRAVFTATTEDRGQRAWMESLLFRWAPEPSEDGPWLRFGLGRTASSFWESADQSEFSYPPMGVYL